MLPSVFYKANSVRLSTKQQLVLANLFQTKRSSQQGLTLLECLMAIVVLSVVLALITPPIVMAVATRVRNQRAEQAFQLSQAEIDRIRLLVERGEYTNADLPPLSTMSDFYKTDAPTSCDTNRANISLTKGLAIDLNNDSTKDFVVQTFRDAGQVTNSTNNRLITFQMGVRVYSYRAFKDCSTTPTPKLSTTPASLSLTSVEQRNSPLSVLYTRVTRGDVKESFDKYKQALQPPP